MCAYLLDARNNTAFETDFPKHYDGENYKRLTLKAGKAAIKQQAVQHLRGILKPGDTVHTVLRHVSKSGMMRHIDCFKMGESGPLYLSGYIAEALDMTRADSGALKVSGCGMDMGFHVVHNLGHVLYPDGFNCAGKCCPSNEHTGAGYEPHTPERRHESGGYALKQTWL